MSSEKPTTQIDRFVTILRSWIRRAASSRDAGRRSRNVSEARQAGMVAMTAQPLAERDGPEPDRQRDAGTPDADTSRQDEPTGPTGASVDEFDAGVAPTEHPDLGDIERAAEPDPDPTDAEPASAAAPDSVIAASVDTDAATDGTLAAERLPSEDAITEPVLPTDEALAATDAAELAAGEAAAANAFAKDEDLGSNPALLDGDAAASTDDTVLPDHEEDVADLTGPPVDRSGFPDLSMDGDTDYAVAGYPSDHMDGEERSDPDDAGLYERETMEVDPLDEADRSDEVGTLGLADSETIADAGTPAEAASPMAIDARNIGVGGTAEVDDTSMLTTADLATDVDTGRDDGDLAAEVDEHAEDDWLAPIAAPAANDAAGIRASPTTDLPSADPSMATYLDAWETSDGSGAESADDPPDDASLGVTTGDPFDAGPTAAILPDQSGATDVDASEPLSDASDAPVDEEMSAAGEAPAGGAHAAAEVDRPPADVAPQPDAASTTAIATTDSALAGRVRGDGSGTCPADYPVKGNASSKIYHLPDSASYGGTRAEWCFASEQDAVNAGYRAPGKRNQSGRRRR